MTQDETSFRSWINVINDDVQVEDGNFVISTPLPAGEEGKVIEWHYVRERSEEEWASLKPRHIKYQSDMRVWHLKRSVVQSVTAIGLNGFW